jgi:hypothetical protein
MSSMIEKVITISFQLMHTHGRIKGGKSYIQSINKILAVIKTGHL